MSSRTISLMLHPDEVDMLSILAQRLRVSKSDIIRNALKPVFEENVNKPESIVLSNRDFQSLLDEMHREPSEEVLKRRRHLEEFSLQGAFSGLRRNGSSV